MTINMCERRFLSPLLLCGESMRKKGMGSSARSTQQMNTAIDDMDDSQLYSSAELFPFLTETERENLSRDVMTTISNELLHPEDLEVAVPRLLRSCANEARELRRSINSVVSSQMLEGHRAVQIIGESSKSIEELRRLFMKQGDLITGMEVTSGSYRELRQLHFLLDNVTSVIQWAEALKEVRYANLYTLVEKRQFATVYKRLSRLQSIRCAVLEKSMNDFRGFKCVFSPYFEKVDAVQTMFVAEMYRLLEEKSIYLAVENALNELPDGQAVRGSIAEFAQLEECLQVFGEELGDAGGILRSADDEPLVTEEQVFSAVRKCVERVWEEQVIIDIVDPFSEISTCLEQMKRVAPLLAALEMTLIPLSTKISFFGTAVVSFNHVVMNLLQSYVDSGSKIGANGLLEASNFLQWYRETMMEANYTAYIDIDAIDTLSASMMTVAVSGLSVHLIHLCRGCAIAVRNGKGGLTTLSSGLPATTGPMDLFAVLQQSLSGLSSGVDVSVMRKIAGACAQGIEAYLVECKLRSDYDYWEEEEGREINKGGNAECVEDAEEKEGMRQRKKNLSSKWKTSGGWKNRDENKNSKTVGKFPVNEWTTRRLAFLYAFCNDCSTIERNMDAIELKFSSCWNDEVNDEYTSPFQRTQDLISENAVFYMDEIVLHVERVVETQWVLVFRSKDWYNNDMNPTQVIIDTMADFIDEEFQIALEEPRVQLTTRRMMFRYVHKYLTTLMEFLGEVIRHPNSKGVEDWNVFIDCFDRDIRLAMNMWKGRVVEGRGRIINTARRALEVTKALFAVKKPVDFNFVLQKDLLDDFGDCPTFVIRFLLHARQKELEKEVRDAMMSLWEERVAHQKRGADDVATVGWTQPPSIFGLLDRSLADLDKKATFFRTSAQKRRVKNEQRRQENEKEAKRIARLARREADALVARVDIPLMPKKPATAEDIEVVKLADILK